MTAQPTAYTTAGRADDRDGRFTLTTRLPAHLVLELDRAVDQTGTPRDRILELALGFWLAVREAGDEPVDGEDERRLAAWKR